jgi:hypothetical protein
MGPRRRSIPDRFVARRSDSSSILPPSALRSGRRNADHPSTTDLRHYVVVQLLWIREDKDGLLGECNHALTGAARADGRRERARNSGLPTLGVDADSTGPATPRARRRGHG